MSVLDIVLLCCFIPGLITGLAKGFVEQAVGLLSMVLGAWLAFRFSDAVSTWLSPHMSSLDPKVLHIVAFVIIVVVVVTLLALLGKLVSKLFSMVSLGWLNRLLGMVFAMLTTLVVLGVLAMVFEGINERFFLVQEETLAASPVYQWIKDFFLNVFPYFKEWFQQAAPAAAAINV